MTASMYAKQRGAIVRKQGDKMTATLSSVSDMAHFHHLLKRNGIEYVERFANCGKAIRFIFFDAELNAERL